MGRISQKYSVSFNLLVRRPRFPGIKKGGVGARRQRIAVASFAFHDKRSAGIRTCRTYARVFERSDIVQRGISVHTHRCTRCQAFRRRRLAIHLLTWIMFKHDAYQSTIVRMFCRFLKREICSQRREQSRVQVAHCGRDHRNTGKVKFLHTP